MDTIRLNTGESLPFIGLGTSNLGKDDTDLFRILNLALDVGYRLFDTANGYKNEHVIGKFIKHLPVNRADVFITSKLDDDAHTYELAKESVEKTLERLQTDYIDLFLVHNPNSQYMRETFGHAAINNPEYWVNANAETWRALEEYKKRGFIRNVGVSNFNLHHLHALIASTDSVPAVNQIKYCIGCYRAQSELLNFCKANSIVVQGYSPFGKGHALDSAPILELAKAKGCSKGDIVLSYLKARHVPTIVRSGNEEHLKSNLYYNEVVLDAEDLSFIESFAIDENWAKIKNPDTGEKYN